MPLLALLSACAGGSSAPPPAPKPVAEARVGGAALFAVNEIVAYTIQDKQGRVFGRTHSTFLETQAGNRQVVTRVEIDPGMLIGKKGQSLTQVEHAVTFRPDLSPLAYKRLSSLSGKYELQFEHDRVQVATDEGSRTVSHRRVRTVLIPPYDLMTLAIALDGEHLETGKSTIVDVFSADALDSAEWPLRAWADPSGAQVVQLPNAKATLDKAGRVARYELDDQPWVFVPEVPPGKPPRVKYEPPLAYAVPRDAHWIDRPISIPVEGGALGGVLSVPNERDQWPKQVVPAVVFLSDLGLQDRHGHQGNIDLGTWELHDALADAGIATLRLDDRGAGASTSSVAPADVGLALMVKDAKAAFAYLEKQPEVNAEKIFLVGHGIGGVAAILAAADLPSAGVVLISTPYRRLNELWVADDVSRGAKKEDAEKQMAIILASFNGSAAAGLTVNVARLQDLAPYKALLVESAKLDLKMIAPLVDEPVAVFAGLEDFQTSWKEDAQKLVEIFSKKSDKKRVKLFAYDHVDHLMKAEAHQSSFERYAENTRRLETRFLTDIKAWIIERAK